LRRRELVIVLTINRQEKKVNLEEDLEDEDEQARKEETNTMAVEETVIAFTIKPQIALDMGTKIIIRMITVPTTETIVQDIDKMMS